MQALFLKLVEYSFVSFICETFLGISIKTCGSVFGLLLRQLPHQCMLPGQMYHVSMPDDIVHDICADGSARTKTYAAEFIYVE